MHAYPDADDARPAAVRNVLHDMMCTPNVFRSSARTVIVSHRRSRQQCLHSLVSVSPLKLSGRLFSAGFSSFPFNHKRSCSNKLEAATVVTVLKSSISSVLLTEELIGRFSEASRLPQYFIQAMFVGAYEVERRIGAEDPWLPMSSFAGFDGFALYASSNVNSCSCPH